MTACSPAWFPSPLPSSRTQRAKRLSGALVASLLLHLLLATSLTGGGRARPASAPSALAVRLVEAPQPTPPEYDPTPATESTEQPRIVERRSRVAALPLRSPQAHGRLPAAAADNSSALSEALDLTYYGARQLDVFPTLTSQLQLESPNNAVGRALFLVMIDAAGVVTDVSVVEATPGSAGDEDAKRAFMKARFTPAYRNGRAVRSRMVIEVNYGGTESASRDGG